MRLSSFFAAFFAGVASLESLESSLTGFVEGAAVVEADELEAAVDVVAICAPELLLVGVAAVGSSAGFELATCAFIRMRSAWSNTSDVMMPSVLTNWRSCRTISR